MLEVYRILNLALIEESGRTKSGYWATSIECNDVVVLKLSHKSRPDLIITIRQGMGAKVELDFESFVGRNTTGTFTVPRFAADAVLNL